jgi:hypothetical protein
MVCLGVACAAQAEAQVEDLDVVWSAPAGCPSREDVAARTRSLLGGRDLSATPLHTSGSIRPHGRGGFILELEIRHAGNRASRRLEGNDCGVLAETAAWLSALVVDPNLEPPDEPPPESPARAPELDTQAEPAEPEPQIEVRPRRGRLPRSYRAGTFAGVGDTDLPAPQASVGARFGLAFGPIYAELAYAHHFARRSLFPGVGDAKIALTTEILRARGCYEWGERLRFGPCVTVEALFTEGQVRGVTEPGEARTAWLLGGFAVQLAYLVYGPLEAMLDAGLDGALSSRPRFEVEGVGTVAEGAAVSWNTHLGLGIRY